MVSDAAGVPHSRPDRLTCPDHVARLRALLAPVDGTGRLHTVPGCWDALTALLIAQAGYDIAFLTGSGVSFTRLGRPDVGLVTMTETADVIAQIRDRTDLCLIADGDDGFGNAANVRRAVRAFERAGASAIQIEDQVHPKRCGHVTGKAVVPVGEAVDRIAAALDARDEMLVVARTDALAIEGLASALERADRFLECGADLVFVEGPRDMAELRAISRQLARRVPLVHNMVEGGNSPVSDGAALAELGYAITLHPLFLLHAFVARAPGWLAKLRLDRRDGGLSRND